MRILIDNALDSCYKKVLYNVNMDIQYCPQYLSKAQIQMFYHIHTLEISTNKGANSYNLKIAKIGN